MRNNTEEAYDRLKKVIPGGVNSPVRASLAVKQTPLVAKYGAQDELVDVDGRHYIDFCMSWGALIHGHAHPEITEVLEKQIRLGTSYGVTTEIEEQLATKTIQLVPSIEQVRFVSSGTEAAMSAVRLARGYTGRNFIIKFSGHYHGHSDFFLVKAGSGAMHLNQESTSLGVPADFVKYTICLTFNDKEALEEAFKSPEYKDKIACVIVEPIAGNMGVVPMEEGFKNLLVKLTKDSGTLLIFDEVMTGFRVAKGGAQSLYQVDPDLTCLGKVIGGGLPAAAFGGKRKIMEKLAPLGGVYQAGTLSGNPLAMQAGLKALEILDRPGFYEELERKSALFADPIKSYIEKHQVNAALQRVGSMVTLFFGIKEAKNVDDAKRADTESFGKFFRALFAKGIFFPPLQQEALFISMAHTDAHLQFAKETILEFLSAWHYDQKND